LSGLQALISVNVKHFLFQLTQQKNADRLEIENTFNARLKELHLELNLTKSKQYANVVDRDAQVRSIQAQIDDFKEHGLMLTPVEMVTISPSDTVELALDKISKANVLSLPVLIPLSALPSDLTASSSTASPSTPSLSPAFPSSGSPLSPSSQAKAFKGFIDILDILIYTNDQEAKGGMNSLAFTTVGDLLESKIRPVPPLVDEISPLSVLIESFAGGRHRAAVQTAEGRFAGIISQSDIVRYLFPALKEDGSMSKIGGSSISSLGHAIKAVISVTRKQSLSECLVAMITNKVTSIAIVDEKNGTLVGNFSVSDFRHTQHHLFKQFKGLKNWRMDTFLGSVHRSSMVPITVGPSHTLLDVVQLLVIHHFHHIWVIDELKLPVGIVSLTDVMRMLTS